MTYSEAKDILRDAVLPQDGLDVASRLEASPGRESLVDMSTVGELPSGDAYADQILRALLVVWRHIVEDSMVDRELLGILVWLGTPIRLFAADSRYAGTRLPQIAIALDAICMSCTAQSGRRE